MSKVKVIFKQNCTLNLNQIEVLDQAFPNNWEPKSIPVCGHKTKTQQEMAFDLRDQTVVFVNPGHAPVLAISLARTNDNVLVFHNDTKSSKSIIDGKIVTVIPPTGWELI